MITSSFSLTATERVLPKLALDFTTASLDSRVTFTRTGDTATVVNSSGYVVGINANLPRFDYTLNTGGLCKGLLIEEARTNICLHSSDYANAVWTKQNMTVSSDAVISPDGTQNADQLTASASAALYETITVVANTAYTFSYYVQLGTASTNRYAIYDATNAVFIVSETLATGVSTNWSRVTVSFTTPATCTSVRVYAHRTATGTINIWGAQLEAGAFPTSYIPTTTTSLTRNADVATMTGTNFSDWYNAVEGTVCAESLLSYTIPAATFPTIFAISDSSVSSNRISMFQFASGGNRGRFQGVVSGSSQWDISSASSVVAVNSFGKFAGAYKSNNIGFSCNSASVGSDAIANLPTVDRLIFGATATGTSAYNGIIRKFFYYPQRLTDAELQAFSK